MVRGKMSLEQQLDYKGNIGVKVRKVAMKPRGQVLRTLFPEPRLML